MVLPFLTSLLGKKGQKKSIYTVNDDGMHQTNQAKARI
jgi:hypothetical protein